jgi:hypothetical protein
MRKATLVLGIALSLVLIALGVASAQDRTVTYTPGASSLQSVTSDLNTEVGELYKRAKAKCTATGTNTIACASIAAPLTAYSDGMTTSFIAPNSISGAATFSQDSVGAVAIQTAAGAAAGTGDITSGTLYTLEYVASTPAWRIVSSGAAGGGGGAAVGADYLQLSNNATNTAERVFTPGTGLGGTDGGANSTYTLSITDAELLAIAGLTSAADRLPYFTGSGTGALATFTAAGRALLDDADATAQRSTLGLGTMATQASSSVSISGGSITGITDLALADGGTGASLSDPNADRFLWWDDSDSAIEFLTVADVVTEAAPTTGDFLIMLDASGALVKVNWSSLPSSSLADGDKGEIVVSSSGTVWEIDQATAVTAFGSGDTFPCFEAGVIKECSFSDLPGAGAGISNLVEDATPQLGGQLDVNGFALGDGTRELLAFIEDGSAVNHVEIENNAAGSPAIIRATGDDTNVDLRLEGKGSGTLTFEGSTIWRADNDGVSSGLDADLLQGTTPSAFGLTLLDDAASSNGRTTLGVVIGTDVQAYDADLTSLGNLADPNADRVIFWDDSLGGYDFLGFGTGFLVTGTTLGVSGLETIWIPASAMVPNTTSGCVAATTETTTNDVMVSVCDFDAAADEAAQFNVAFPKSWNESTITAEFSWTAASGTGNVVWAMQCLARSNDDALDTAFGTAQTVTDALIATGDLHITSATSALTVGGTPAEGDVTWCRVYRDADNGSDTFSADARLIGVKVLYSINQLTDD